MAVEAESDAHQSQTPEDSGPSKDVDQSTEEPGGVKKSKNQQKREARLAARLAERPAKRAAERARKKARKAEARLQAPNEQEQDGLKRRKLDQEPKVVFPATIVFDCSFDEKMSQKASDSFCPCLLQSSQILTGFNL